MKLDEDFIISIAELLHVNGTQAKPRTLENLVTHDLKIFGCLVTVLAYIHMYISTKLRVAPLLMGTSLILDNHVMIHWQLSRQKVFADQYRMTIMWAQVKSSSRSRVFFLS